MWFEDEVEPDNWSNPVHKVKAPRVPLAPLEPVEFETVLQMIKVCEPDTFCGIRDKALSFSSYWIPECEQGNF